MRGLRVPQSWISKFPTRYLATAPPSPKKKKLGSTISLDHFLQRGKAISLWRTILRDSRRIADANTRKETIDFARVEFKRNMHVTDISQIRYLIGTGKTQWDGMERYIDGL
ncbi:LYR motif-containing protein 2 [Phlyctema vagabunda]|uniref:LYR motif-containing protein 2 n=1 Tax=Phlyctema vagabunda TaxID=108571 RepID=A0ABR4PU24_9HELO